MEDRRIEELQNKVQELIQQQNKISREIRDLQITLDSLAYQKHKKSTPRQDQLIEPDKENTMIPAKKVKRDLERFIGENLISKLGILITVVGVGIGTKYAIDSGIVNATTRVILGYLVSFGLMGFALFLKKSYQSFSAVLLSGAFAILYFLTFASYDFYGFIGKGPAFGGMVLLTIVTVYSAIHYNKSIIAHMGLVGSYAVPFLLSDGSGEVLYLFIYMSIINLGILAVSIKKYWQSLHYSALIFTWLIVTAWFLDRYTNEEFVLGMSFLFVFFLLFYASFIANKVIYQKAFSRGDIFLISTNSLIFYVIGFALISKYYNTDAYLGYFTLVNAAVHYLVGIVARWSDKDNQSLFRFIVGLAIVYVTLTIPVLLDGGWITVLWVGEAAVLSWAGTSKNGLAYQRMSHGLVLLSFISLFLEWGERSSTTSVAPFANHFMIVSLLFAGGMSVITWFSLRDHRVPTRLYEHVMKYASPGLLIVSLYVTFALEIHGYWASYTSGVGSEMELVLLISYSFLYLSGLELINRMFFQNRVLWYAFPTAIVLIIPSLLNSTAALSDLTAHYQTAQGSLVDLLVRYLLFSSMALFTWSMWRVYKRNVLSNPIKKALDTLLLLTILWISSVELVHWQELFGLESTTKLTLSILWGVSAVVWIGVGINYSKKHLRIASICLLGLTLLKLFFYDISHLSNLSKTVVLVILGVLMLIASFLYNRLTGEEK